MSDNKFEVDDTAPHVDHSVLASRMGANAVVSALLLKLGGEVVLTMQDLKRIEGTQLLESNQQAQTGLPDGQGLAFKLRFPIEPTPGSVQ